MRRILYFLALLPLFYLGCKSTSRVTKTNLAYHYFNEPTVIHPVYKVYHNNDDISTFYVRVKSSEILYSKNNPRKEFLGKMVMQIAVYDFSGKNLVASDTVYLYDRGGPEEDRYLIGSLEMKLPYGSRYLAEITFDDLYRMQYVQDVHFINKTDEYSEENYLVKNQKGEVQFGNAFDPGTKLIVETNRNLPSKLKILSFDPYEKLPPPPFALIENYSPQLTGQTERSIETKGRQFELELGEAGIYHIPNAVDGSSGLTFLVFHSYYPYIKTVASMIRPLRFITTKQEYQKLVDSEELKKDVDEFWFKMAGNAERAAEIIEEFYGRVEVANLQFTSYTQGWKTDRGLIYIIYGPPTTVYKTQGYERWTYSEKNNILSVEFTFYRVDNAFSMNDYQLDRSNGYKSSWYRAIDNWRQGRVY